MAGSNMKDIKRRIKSVESTMQITKAMQLVASSKLRKAKERADKARPFYNTLYDTICEIVSESSDFASSYIKKRKLKNALLVVIAGDRGLAGGFNTNILKLSLNHAEELAEKGMTVSICAIGKKAADFYAKKEYKLVQKHVGISETLKIYDAMNIADTLVDGFLGGTYDKVELFYNGFLNALSQETKIVEMLPLSIDTFKKKEKATQLITYDPSPEAVFNSLMPKYVSGILYGAIVDSFAAEQAARRNAMESASDNAKEMIDSLSLMYNRARQAAITQEITEIVSGVQANG